MKKILVFMLVLAISASAFVSCGKKEKTEEGTEVKTGVETEGKQEEVKEATEEKSEEKNEKPAKTEEKAEEKPSEKVEEKPVVNYNTEEDKAAAKSAVEGYLNGYCAFDVAAMTQYTNTDLSDKVNFTDYGEFIARKVRGYFNEEETTTVFAEEIANLETRCKEAILKSASYEIGDAEYVGTTWQFDVKTKNITLTDIFSVVSGDEAKKLTEQLLDELITKLQDPNITNEEINVLTQDMLKVSLNAIVDLVTKSCESTEPKAKDYTVTAVKAGDKWVVDYNGKGAQDIVASLNDNSKG